MNQRSHLLRSETQRYALFGILFGLLFPIVATIIRLVEMDLPLSLSGVAEAQSADSLLWIIDTAPFFLGLVAAFAGRRQDTLQNLNSDLRNRESELRAVQNTLEQRVEQRTQELSIATQQAEKRASHLQSIVEIARTAIAIRNTDQLLPLLVQAIHQQFGFDHVDIYLLDELNQFAILRATNSEAGRRMLEHGHRIKVGDDSLVSDVARSGQARTATAEQRNLLVSDTFSEIALPLKAGNQIIGVIAIQSSETNAFSQSEIDTLSILADQIGIATQNAMLYEQSQRALREAELASMQASGQAWKGYTKAIQTQGYRYNGIKPEPLKEMMPSGEDKGSLLHPVRLRGQTIGRLELKASNPSRQWTEDELAILEATAERVAIALEGARLLEEAQKRASRESFLSDMAAKLGASSKLDSVLRDTVEELGRTLKGSTVSFQLVDPLAQPPSDLPKSNGNSAGNEKSE